MKYFTYYITNVINVSFFTNKILLFVCFFFQKHCVRMINPIL